MILRNELKDPAALIRIGMGCILIFNVTHWCVHPTAIFWRDVVDGVSGAVLGIAIGTLLLAARMNGRRRRRGIGDTSCA
ncbi:MAG TPA: hypothetical protein VHL58_14240 [Thermoanaerobaculia bacterium]|nr:hypothetical protein [Thermoanaerobaculia bacterium]